MIWDKHLINHSHIYAVQKDVYVGVSVRLIKHSQKK